jgi:hypothetical protein
MSLSGAFILMVFYKTFNMMQLDARYIVSFCPELEGMGEATVIQTPYASKPAKHKLQVRILLIVVCENYKWDSYQFVPICLPPY